MPPTLTAEEAYESVRLRLGADVDFDIQEFALGWVVSFERGPSNPTARGEVMTIRAVLDRTSRDWVVYPPMEEVSEIARRHALRAQACERFPAVVTDRLLAAGWYPGRKVDDTMLRTYDAEVRALPAVVDAWNHRRPPTTPEERALAHDGAVREFDLGWVLIPRKGPPHDDLSRPPGTVGSAMGVIDRGSGEYTGFPGMPVEEVIRLYRLRRETHRPARPAPADVPLPVGVAPRPGLFVHDAAHAALAEFGNLTFERGGGDTTRFAPAAYQPEAFDMEDIDVRLGLPVAPIGGERSCEDSPYDDQPDFIMDIAGRVFSINGGMYKDDDNYLLAESIGDAFIALFGGRGVDVRWVLNGPGRLAERTRTGFTGRYRRFDQQHIEEEYTS